MKKTNQNEFSDALTTVEVARIEGVSRRTVLRRCSKSDGYAVRTSGGDFAISVEKLAPEHHDRAWKVIRRRQLQRVSGELSGIASTYERLSLDGFSHTVLGKAGWDDMGALALLFSARAAALAFAEPLPEGYANLKALALAEAAPPAPQPVTVEIIENLKAICGEVRGIQYAMTRHLHHSENARRAADALCAVIAALDGTAAAVAPAPVKPQALTEGQIAQLHEIEDISEVAATRASLVHAGTPWADPAIFTHLEIKSLLEAVTEGLGAKG